MPNLVVTIGVSGAGKTTWARKFKNWEVIDSDETRHDLFGDETYQGDNNRVFDTMRRKAIAALQRGKDVCYCATNLSSKKRINLLRDIGNFDRAIAIVFAVPIQECKKRNKCRSRRVPEEAIDRQLKSFQMPYFEEGWDNIEVVGGDSACQNDLKNSMRCFGSQDNPHHSKTLFDHCCCCGDALVKTHDAPLIAAGYLHDCGKTLTKTYDEDGVAHYFGHASAGSYLALCVGASIETAILICYHMAPFDTNGKKVWRSRLGERNWQRIELLHKADLEAH